MSAEASHQRHRTRARLRFGPVCRLMTLAVAVAPLVRWAVLYCSVQAGHDWQRACPHCGTRIDMNNWRPLTPPGRCVHCHRRIGAPPWSVETVLVMAALACTRLPLWIIPAYAWWAIVGVALCFIDIATYRLPDRLTWPAVGGFLLLASLATLHGYSGAWLRAALAGALVTVVLGICVLIWPHLLGRGDAKYGAAIGAAAGWTSWFAVYAAIFTATLLGTLVGIGLVVAGRASRRTPLPFGPFLFVGTMLVVALLHM